MNTDEGSGLHVRGVNKAYGARSVLTNITLDVMPGEITALIGPNGSGKSTLLRALSLLEPPDSGHISIDQRHWNFPEAAAESFAEVWPNLTVVFQQLFLWPHLTVKDNLGLALRKRPECHDRLNELVGRFDLSEFLGRYPNQISLGQRQRVAIARALALRPKYLLLDEVTSALDVRQTSTLLGELQQLRDSGVGILLVTHLIGFARNAASRIAFLSNGTIVESGGIEVLSTPAQAEVREFLSLLEGQPVTRPVSASAASMRQATGEHQ